MSFGFDSAGNIKFEKSSKGSKLKGSKGSRATGTFSRNDVRAMYKTIFAKWNGTWLPRGSYGIHWQLRGLCGYYGAYVAVMGSMWLLCGLCDYYGVYVAIMWSMWLLCGLCGYYGVYVAIMGSMWLLWGLCGYYGVYVAVTGSHVALTGYVNPNPRPIYTIRKTWNPFCPVFRTLGKKGSQKGSLHVQEPKKKVPYITKNYSKEPK